MSPRGTTCPNMASELDEGGCKCCNCRSPNMNIKSKENCALCKTGVPRGPDPICLREIISNSYESVTLEPLSFSSRDPIYYCDKDIRIQIESSAQLDKACYYYGAFTSEQSRILLKHCKVGTYLIRDSSDPKHLYSLSVKTERGPTSVRITYFKGQFQFDCEKRLKNDLPKFNCIIKLVDFYTRQSKQRKIAYRWLENSGKKDLKMFLIRPRLNQIPSLKHFSRLNINRSFPLRCDIMESRDNVQKLPLPELLKVYLNDYPYIN